MTNPGVLEEAAQMARERKANPILPRHREASNDTVADELATIVSTSKIGTDKCAGIVTRKLSNGHRYIISTRQSYEVDVATAKRKATAASEARLLARLEEDEMVEAVARALIDSDPCVTGYHQTHIDMKAPYARSALTAIADRLKGERP